MCQNIILEADELEYMNKSEQAKVKSIISKNDFGSVLAGGLRRQLSESIQQPVIS